MGLRYDYQMYNSSTGYASLGKSPGQNQKKRGGECKFLSSSNATKQQQKIATIVAEAQMRKSFRYAELVVILSGRHQNTAQPLIQISVTNIPRCNSMAVLNAEDACERCQWPVPLAFFRQRDEEEWQLRNASCLGELPPPKLRSNISRVGCFVTQED